MIGAGDFGNFQADDLCYQKKPSTANAIFKIAVMFQHVNGYSDWH
jgi:hypothetical protein